MWRDLQRTVVQPPAQARWALRSACLTNSSSWAQFETLYSVLRQTTDIKNWEVVQFLSCHFCDTFFFPFSFGLKPRVILSSSTYTRKACRTTSSRNSRSTKLHLKTCDWLCSVKYMLDKHRFNITVSLELMPHQIIISSFETMGSTGCDDQS